MKSVGLTITSLPARSDRNPEQRLMAFVLWRLEPRSPDAPTGLRLQGSDQCRIAVVVGRWCRRESAWGQPASRAHWSSASAEPQIAAAASVFSRYGLAPSACIAFERELIRIIFRRKSALVTEIWKGVVGAALAASRTAKGVGKQRRRAIQGTSLAVDHWLGFGVQ